ncbi:type IV pilus modification PilV family protein [Taklimakanibacter lacteus]|uniref:type IV pilus modification PilV family protein n=1 Tax=Taklimakanibacter lacteus TaxID=2268456 RepID=UPI0013C4A3C1
MGGREDGYSLLEVLVAFVILSGAVIMSFRIFGDGLRRLDAADRQMEMVAVGQDLLSDLQLKPVLQPGRMSGVSQGYAWTIMLTPAADQDPAPNALALVHVRVEVRQEDATVPGFDLETTLLARIE